MSYITAEQIREKRNAIKAAFPGWKFSITRKHLSTIKVVVQQAYISVPNKIGGLENIGFPVYALEKA